MPGKDDPAVELVLLDGAGERGLCAGGDVRSLYESRTQGSALRGQFWRDEYRLNALIGRYPKPYVAIQDGIVMGGGIGLSAHARHRIVTERSQLAMPETGIGLIPDVGGTWLLAHAPGETGVYLGLTGETMRAADAIYARFSDTSGAFGQARRADRAAGRSRRRPRRRGDRAPCRGARRPVQLERRRGDIDRAFAGSERRGISGRAGRHAGRVGGQDRAALAQKSPKALKLTLAAIRKRAALPRWRRR